MLGILLLSVCYVIYRKKSNEKYYLPVKHYLVKYNNKIYFNQNTFLKKNPSSDMYDSLGRFKNQ